MRKQRHKEYACCPLEAALDVMGGKWKATVLFQLLTQTRRFNELRRLLPNITQRMLTAQLRDLEADGLIIRTVYAVVPPKVEYSLTPMGQSLEPVMRALYHWGEGFKESVSVNNILRTEAVENHKKQEALS